MAARTLRRRHLTGLALALAGMARSASATGVPVTGTPALLPRSTAWEMEAQDDPQRRYRIMVSWPEAAPPPAGYPVLYLLDGKATFPIAVAAARQQERDLASADVAPGLLVGIDHAGEPAPGIDRRARDYTLPVRAWPPGQEPAMPFSPPPPGAGQADAFLEFLVATIMPEIERRWPADPARRGIFGHSYGGLFVLHAFFSRPGLFRRSIAASPSIWWQGGAVLEEERRFTTTPPALAPTLGLLLTAGSEEQPGPEVVLTPERRARLQKARMLDQARGLAERLTALGTRGPEVALRIFPGENHGSVVLPAIRQGLRFALPAQG